MAEIDQDKLLHLMDRSSKGDSHAFTSIYNLTSPHIHRFIQRRLVDHAHVEDLVQETYLIAWQKCGHFHGDSAVETWLCGIARLVILRHLQRSGSTQISNVGISGEIARSRIDSPDINTICLIHDMQALIRCLPPAQRQAVHLVFFDRLSLVQAAIQAHCTLAQIRHRVHQACAQLCEWLS